MIGFPKLALEYPEQVQCILMRDLAATEPVCYPHILSSRMTG